jgi:hypothetical protein
MSKTTIIGSTTTVTLTSANSPLYNTGIVNPTFSGYGANGVYSGVYVGAILKNNSHISGNFGAGIKILYGVDGGAGGTGVDFTTAGTVTNYGLVEGGAGGYGIDLGGSGGVGVALTGDTSKLTNLGNEVTGTAGIYGGKGGYSYGGVAGSGGAAVVLNSGATLANSSHIHGGNGGATYYGSGGGVGGNGGAGVSDPGGGTVTNFDAINGGSINQAGANGVGGDGVDMTGGTLTNSALSTDGDIRGGSVGTSGSGSGGVGVDMQGGALTNDLSCAIAGGSVNTHNTLDTGNGGAGVVLANSATLSNSGNVAGGVATAGDGGVGVTAVGAVTSGFNIGNYYSESALGHIAGGTSYSGGTGGDGVNLGADATMFNQSDPLEGGGVTGGGSDEGNGGVGVDLLAKGAALTNTGSIYGGSSGGDGTVGGAGVELTAGTNANNSGTIEGGGGNSATASGGVGVELNGGQLVTSGTIEGGLNMSALHADAVQFGSVASTLIVEPGAVFNGQVAANASVDDTLQLAGTESGGTGITLGTQFTGFQTLDFASGAQWTVDVGAGAAGASPGMTVTGFAIGDTIDFTNQTLSMATVEADFKGASVVSLGGGEYGFNGSASGETFTDPTDGTLTFNGNFSADHFVFSGDAMDMFLVFGPVPCYCRGTLIRTATGEKRVEDLAIGDLVLTASGEARPIRWLGSRGLDCTRHPKPAAVWPIRIQAGAFGQDLPVRDLWVSPGHSMLVEGVLIQAEKLVNGATIVQVPRERVEYWHVELESHDILLAEGLPAESYLDTGNRTAFIDGGAYLEAYPDFAPKHWRDTCVPLVLEGPAVQSAKEALLARAQALGYVLTEEADLHLIADGQRIDPVRLSQMRLAFMLPVAASSIELRCRSFTPAHMDPASDDQRSLGLCVGRLQLDGIDVALEDEAAFALGWHKLEGDPEGRQWRWSQDRTALPAGTRLVVIDVAGPGHYWAKPKSAVVALFG